MEGTANFNSWRSLFGLLVLATVVTFSGCFGTAAQMLYFIKGDKVKAAYNGLKNKRVAVVFESDATSYGPNPLTEMMANMLAIQLNQNVKKIEMVPFDEVQDWKDRNAWKEINYQELGKSVQAEMVVAIDVSGYSIHEGTTMFKGRSTVKTTVYDITNNGEITFVHGPELFEFPKSHARPAIGTTEADFERAYVSQIIQQISWLFYDHERIEGIARDGWIYD